MVNNMKVRVVKGYKVNKPWVAALEEGGIDKYEVRAWTKCGAARKLADTQDEVPYSLIKSAC